MAASFVHLNVHSEYSILDGMCRPSQLAQRAKELGMSAVALTDHNNLYAAIKHFSACKKAGIKPIFGCDVSLAPGSVDDRNPITGRKNFTRLILLAETQTGWDNLQKLVSKSNLDGVWLGIPRVDREMLREFSEGLICLSGGLEGPVGEWLLLGEKEKAKETLAELIEIFGREQVYVELQNHELEAQIESIPQFCALAEEAGVRTVATNDVHFLKQEDQDAHDAFICIGQGRLIIDENRQHYSPEVYLKSAEEMRTLFAEIPEACDATLEIAERCQVEFVLDSTSSEKYPQFDAPDGSPREEYLMKLCQEGLVHRYGAEKAADPEIQERLVHEVDIINGLGFSSYFLITADFIRWSRDNGIPVGPGRGSAAGSLVAYSLGITNICPLRFGLIFERFLNPERVSPPDVDIDFDPVGRADVIQYVREKYGERNVSHIITYGTMAARSVIRDVARVMGVPRAEANFITKMIEAKPGVKLQSEWDEKAELREHIESSSTYQELWDYALRLEGLVRNVGVHAAGVVIGDKPLDEHIPLTRSADGEVVTQYDMGAITDVGLLKMDFLGLKNLTVIKDTVALIQQQNPDFEVEKVPLDDQKTFDLLNRGDTMGVFQLESGGMVETCRKYQLEKIDDLIDLIAVYRPGAMDFIDQMIAVRRGEKKPMYEHPLLQQVSGDTYGVMIYQEQVQNAAKLLAGYSLGSADLLRRAMGKKDPEIMKQERAHFIQGCWETNQIEEHLADAIFKKIEMFAGYGFNKSHSACYAHISYWTAYLKANYPVEFMAALLSNEIKNIDKISVFVAECQSMKIEILPPHLNRSQLYFAPEKMPSGEVAVRYGLAAVKNVGPAAMALAIENREQNGEFKSLEDFANRLDSRVINKRILENLVKAGVFDWTGEGRASMVHRLEQVVASASSVHRDRESGQISMFEGVDFGRAPTPAAFDEIEEWSKDERLAMEKDLLGFYVTGHPLDKFREVLDSDRYNKLGLVEELVSSDRRKRHAFAGLVRSVEGRLTKNGKPFGIVTVEDFTGAREMLIWAESYVPARDKGFLEVGKAIRFKAAVERDQRTDGVRITGYEIAELKGARKKSDALELFLWPSRSSEQELEKIRKILLANPGKTKVVIHFNNSAGKRVTIELSEKYRVKVTAKLNSALLRWLD